MEPPPPRAAAVGTARVSKLFLCPDTGVLQPFAGTVTSYSVKNKWYQVTYEDGDREELTWSELKAILLPATTRGGGTSPAAGKRSLHQQHAEKQQQKGRQPRRASSVAASTAIAAQAAGVGAEGADADAAASSDGGAAAKPAAELTDAAALVQRPAKKPRRSGAAAAAGEPASAAAAEAAAAGGDAGGGAAASASRKKKKHKAAAAADALAAAAAAGADAGAAADGGDDSGRRPSKKARKHDDKPAAAAAAAGAGAAGPTAGKPPTVPKKKDTAAAAAMAGGGGSTKKAGDALVKPQGKKQSKQKAAEQAAAASQAAAAAASQAAADSTTAAAGAASADDGSSSRPAKKLTNVQRLQLALDTNACAQTLEAAFRKAEAASVADVAAVRAAAAAAAPVIMLPRPAAAAGKQGGGSSSKQQEEQGEELPFWAATDAHLEECLSKEATLEALTAQAAARSIQPGKEPWRRFALPQALLQEEQEAGAGAGASDAAAGSSEGQQQKKKKAAKGSSDAAAATEAAAPQTTTKKGKQQEAASSDAAAAAAAAAAAGGGGSGGRSKASTSAAAATVDPATVAAAARGDAAAVKCLALAAARGKHPVLFVADQPFADADGALAKAVAETSTNFWRVYREALGSEVARVRGRLAELAASGGAGKKPSTRADRVAESSVLTAGQSVNDRDGWGHVPGIAVNNKWCLRSEVLALGLHRIPMGGIDTGSLPVPVVVSGTTYADLRAATCVVSSAIYRTDQDAEHGKIIAYTGAGGNDLLGGKEQLFDQKLATLGNKALLVNYALGIPVRMLRRNDDTDSSTDTSLFYDGIYDVVGVVRQRLPATDKQLAKNAATVKISGVVYGPLVYVYGLKRRTGQLPSLSKPIERFKGVRTAARQVTLATRHNLVALDVSKGAEGDMQVLAVNEVDDDLPPGILKTDKRWLAPELKGEALAKLQEDPNRGFVYARTNTYAPDVRPPAPPTLLWEGTQEGDAALYDIEQGRAEQVAARAAPSGGEWWNQQYVVAQPGEAPHDILKRINGGHLPWTVMEEATQQQQQATAAGGGGAGTSSSAAAAAAAAGGGKKAGRKQKSKDIPIARNTCRVLIECGDWTGCTDSDCPQRQAHRPLHYRLEVFKTPDRGWSVRSWDHITAGSLVCVMTGHVTRDVDVDHSSSVYLFELLPRPDYNDAGKPLRVPLVLDCKNTLCALQRGGVARFINHSCAPNLYVQPMCCGHTDTDLVEIGLFAATHIAPFEELSYDYGASYVSSWGGACLCGADVCVSKLGAAPAAAEPAQEQENEEGREGEEEPLHEEGAGDDDDEEEQAVSADGASE